MNQRNTRRIALVLTLTCIAVSAGRADLGVLPRKQSEFIEDNCFSCHDNESRKGGLNLEALTFDLGEQATLLKWVDIYDRVTRGEMPPKNRSQPPPDDVRSFADSLKTHLGTADKRLQQEHSRVMLRRLNRYEYENVLRDLLNAPWLKIKERLPEDREMHGFNKTGAALEMSYVEMGRYLSAADYALREVVARESSRPPTKITRYYAREQKSFVNKNTPLQGPPHRRTFPVFESSAQPDARSGKIPLTVGSADPEVREKEAMGAVSSSYQPFELAFDSFTAPSPGRYRLRIAAHSIWVGPGPAASWWIPNLDDISPGRRSEPVIIYAQTPPRNLRRIGEFDAVAEPGVYELDVWLLEGETIRPDAARLSRTRGPSTQSPLARLDGMPGVAFRWLEVEGPIYDKWPAAGHQFLFGDLPIKPAPDNTHLHIEVVSKNPMLDAQALLRRFVKRAWRRPHEDKEIQRYLPIIERSLAEGSGFAEAMLAGYSAALCSTAFLYLHENPGRLDDPALAMRLSLFLENSAPDETLQRLADAGSLSKPAVLRAQTERLLNTPQSRRFINAFLDYWLNLREISSVSPDASLYPDYYLNDLLTESALEETQQYFAEIVKKDLPVRSLIVSDFAFVNESLAIHYGLEPFEGVTLRRVALPADSFRGGLLTQASVLKVTANGTTTSPVLRGVWILDRILGQRPRPPPPGTPAVEPDISGAVSIREQVERHRADPACASCHSKIDPVGFALESFDVMGGHRERYRAMADGVAPAIGFGHNGNKFGFHWGLLVDSSGELADGRRFHDVRELKRMLLSDERAIARSFLHRLIVYATGEPPRFSDRPAVEAILDRASRRQFGVRTLIHEVVNSDLFLNK